MKLSRILMLFVACICVFACSINGVFATWLYSETPIIRPKDENFTLQFNDFVYAPIDMPEVEVNALQRLSDILNNKYTTETITNSRDYLINETIQVFWGGNIYADPYVGSMDSTYAQQISNLFEDVLFETGVSFILKNQDLNGDGFREIAMYSTSDPLDCKWDYDGTVCVFVSVFTPIIDEGNQILGYNLVCESLRGFCSQVFYDYESWLPSFTTDSWANGVGFYYHTGIVAIEYPDDHDYNKYNRVYYPPYDEWWSNGTLPFGKTLSQCLEGVIPNLKK